jgi:hypothetical protein
MTLHENTNFTMELYAQLFHDLVRHIIPFDLVIFSVLIDNPPAHSSRLDFFWEKQIRRFCM